MTSCTAAEFDLIGDIYDAALDASLWPRVMQTIAELSQAKSSIILATDLLNVDYNLLIPHNLSPDSLREYRERGLDRIDMEVTGKALLRGGLGVASEVGTMYGSLEAWRKVGGEFYAFMQKQDIAMLGGVVLDAGDFRWSVLGIHRPEAAGFFDAAAIAFLNRMSPHIRRALQIHRQLSLTRRQNAVLYALLENLKVGVLLLNASGRIAHANGAAENLLRHEGCLKVTSHGLQCSDPGQNQQLQQLIRGAIETSQRDCQGNTGGVIGLSDASTPTPLMLSVLPLSALDAYRDLHADDIAAAIFITDPSRGHSLSEKLLRENYRLSPREIEICQQFINTPVLEALAVQVGLTLSSVRTYMKGIYEKTGQHSQADLMRLLMGLTLDFQHIR